MYLIVKLTVLLSAVLAYRASAKIQVDLEVERFEFEKPSALSVLDFERFKYKKFNRTSKVFSGEIEFLKDITNDHVVMVELYKMEGNEYRKTPFKIGPYPSCEFIEKETMFYPELVQYSDVPKPGTCPLPKGVYTINNYVMDASKLPQNFEGKYRGRILVLSNNQVIDDSSVYTNIRRDFVY